MIKEKQTKNQQKTSTHLPPLSPLPLQAGSPVHLLCQQKGLFRANSGCLTAGSDPFFCLLTLLETRMKDASHSLDSKSVESFLTG